MAKTYLQLNNQITDWVNQHNGIVNNVGDLSSLTGTLGAAYDSDLVTAINRVHSLTSSLDSAQFNSILTLNHTM